MTESTSTEPSREETYLEWRQRLADRQAAWRQPDESAPTVSSEWDPAALFVKNEPGPASTVGDAGSQTIDLRADPPSGGGPVATEAPAPAPAPRQQPQARPAARPQQAAPPATPTPSKARTRPPAPKPGAAAKARADRPEPPTRSTAAPKPAAPRAKAAPPEPEPLDRQAQFDSVMARLERRAARPVPKKKAPPIADALRELNQRRIDGLITDDEFKARKAELFDRSSKP